MYFRTEKVNLKSSIEVRRVSEFLSQFDLQYDDVDYTIIIKENNNIIATCSKKNNIVKCFAIDENYQGQGIAGILITDITNELFDENIYHSFIFTKPKNKCIFEGLGYNSIVDTDKVSLMEIGNNNIKNYLKKIKKDYDINDNDEYAALVMNCNPFTLGHKYLIEMAAKENENVLVFVVEEDKSSFSFKDRLNLVKLGVKEFENVKVIPGGEYIISSATFPSYFLRKNDDVMKEYTKVDASIFGKYFAKEINIVRRYVGTEPYCGVTDTYNETLQEILPRYGVNIKVVERMSLESGIISASKVREFLKYGELDKVKELVPLTTYEFLIGNDGKKVIDLIKSSDKKH